MDESDSGPRRRRGDLAPNAELWTALDEGRGLTAILTDFYARVFDDPRLSPFFEHVTRSWVIQKQYSFLCDIISGSRTYFGLRPRNAHHWMVISDELFDYREALMRESLERYGLEPRLREEFLKIDEVFRKQIVKSRPIPRKIRGEELPLDGYEALPLGVGSICDGCDEVLPAGATVAVHLRTGRSFCDACVPLTESPDAAPARAPRQS